MSYYQYPLIESIDPCGYSESLLSLTQFLQHSFVKCFAGMLNKALVSQNAKLRLRLILLCQTNYYPVQLHSIPRLYSDTYITLSTVMGRFVLATPVESNLNTFGFDKLQNVHRVLQSLQETCSGIENRNKLRGLFS